jgi:ABC-type amino acid transport system permease subunit
MLVALTLLSSLCLLAEAAGVLAPALLYSAPLLIVALPLLAGRYVGEDRIVGLAEAARGRRHAARALRLPTPPAMRRATQIVPRGGRLIAHSLAVRPPPAALLSR